MSDQREARLVKRLRAFADAGEARIYTVKLDTLLRQAADEIERLTESMTLANVIAIGNKWTAAEARIAKLRGALEWYADGNHLMKISNKWTGKNEIHISDLGSYARAALEADGEGT